MGTKIKVQYMNRPTFWMIKYMNGSVFSKARHMNGVCFEILARTPVPQLPPRYLPPSPWPRDTRGSMFFSDRKSAVCIHSQSKKYFSSISQISPLSELPFFFFFFCFFFFLFLFFFFGNPIKWGPVASTRTLQNNDVDEVAESTQVIKSDL